MSAGRLGSKVRNSINQGAIVKPQLMLSGRSLQPTPIIGRPKTSIQPLKRESTPLMSGYLTAASTTQSQSRLRSQRHTIRKQSLDNRGTQGQSVGAWMDEALTVVPLKGEEAHHGPGPVTWGFYRPRSTKHATGKGAKSRTEHREPQHGHYLTILTEQGTGT